MKRDIIVEGMTCHACKMLIEDVCEDFPEISSAVVDLESGMLSIDVIDGFDLNLLKNEMESVGDFAITL
jgi:copper chaperone CopZ